MRGINIIQSVVAPAEVRALAVAQAAALGMIEETTQMELHGMEIILIAGSDRVWYDRENNTDGTPWYGNI